jgi:hypothetical protein
LLYSQRSASAEQPPEITALRLFRDPVTCIALQLVAEELLLAEGFTDVHHTVAAIKVGFELLRVCT